MPFTKISAAEQGLVQMIIVGEWLLISKGGCIRDKL